MSLLIESFLDLLEPLGGVTARRLFGGHGFYKDDVIFALQSRGQLFIKTDAENRERFEQAGGLPFTHRDKDRKGTLPYHEPPESAFINPQKMKPWAVLGFEAAQRAFKKKSPGSKSKKQGSSKSKSPKSKRTRQPD